MTTQRHWGHVRGLSMEGTGKSREEKKVAGRRTHMSAWQIHEYSLRVICQFADKYRVQLQVHQLQAE